MVYSPEGQSTSTGLICRAQQEDQHAWNRLVRLYGPLVYHWVRKTGISENDAADIGQEVFRTAATKISDFDPTGSGSGFRAWLRTITRNKIGDFLRQARRREVGYGGSDSWISKVRFDEGEDDESTGDGKSNSSELDYLFSAALNLIKTDFLPQTWQAFWRAAIDDEPVQQIAQDLDMSTKAIRQAKYRVLKRLRDEFGDLFD